MPNSARTEAARFKQARRGLLERPIRQEHSRNGGVVHGVVAAPVVRVVFHDFSRNDAECGASGAARAFGVADLKIGADRDLAAVVVPLLTLVHCA